MDYFIGIFIWIYPLNSLTLLFCKKISLNNTWKDLYGFLCFNQFYRIQEGVALQSYDFSIPVCSRMWIKVALPVAFWIWHSNNTQNTMELCICIFWHQWQLFYDYIEFISIGMGKLKIAFILENCKSRVFLAHLSWIFC